MISKPSRGAACVLAASISAISTTASGAGFAIIEQSVKGLGSAFAGGSASADDPSTVYFNPAGMSRLQGTQFDTALHVIAPSSEFSNQGSTVNALLGGGVLLGGNGGDAGVIGLVPNLYVTQAVGEKFAVGLGVNAPFGLKTDYQDGWVGRYHALTSSMKTININPSFSVKLSDRFAFGAGVNAQYIEARLTNAVDQSGVCLGLLGAGPCAGAGLVTPGAIATDANIDLEADDWSVGFNAGVLFNASDSTRIGLHYRSKISHKLKGAANFSNITLPAAITAGGAFTDQSATAEVTLPETVSFSVYQQMNDRLGIMGDVTWTKWNRFQNLIIRFQGGHPTNTTPELWDNNIRVSLGASYKYNSKLTLRGGVAYDQSPIPNSTLRTPRIPGDDRYWVAIGASYQASDRLSIDVGYAHLFVGDVPIANTEVNTAHVLTGEFDADVNIFSGQVNYRF